MTTQKQQTRERLLEVAEEVFAQRGYYDAAVDEIVEKSGMSKGAVYFHFPSKERLFLAVMDQLGKRLIHRIEREIAPLTDPVRRLDMAMETTVRTLTKHKSLAKLLLVKGYSMGPAFAKRRQEIMGRFAEMTEGLMREAQGESARVDAGLAALAWQGAISETVVRWLETGRPHPVEEALPTLRAMLHGALGIGEAS
ncbi:MAG: TetR/AcrR family transcriptional regulator [Chloroflexi bacterium]|nr:TetR/AcrR family transcriptional regulator [Chloroflexota bacterium]